jgi:Rieske Fe-S protein
MERRKLIQTISAIPVVGALLAFMSPIYRVLRPTAKAFDFTRPVDQIDLRSQRIAFVDELEEDWATVEFVYRQVNVEYSARGQQINSVPGYITRIPDEFVSGDLPEDRYYCLQRICPHLGCTFNYVDEAQDVRNEYNFPQAADHPYYCCPCHLSVYDPIEMAEIDGEPARGKVVSGPAPRPPRRFVIEIRGNEIYISGMEGGGIA